MRSLKNQQPRESWKIITEHKNALIHKLHSTSYTTFFLKSINDINSNKDMETDHDNANDSFDESINDDIENEVNQPITESEILKYVKLLKNSQASCADNI